MADKIDQKAPEGSTPTPNEKPLSAAEIQAIQQQSQKQTDAVSWQDQMMSGSGSELKSDPNSQNATAFPQNTPESEAELAAQTQQIVDRNEAQTNPKVDVALQTNQEDSGLDLDRESIKEGLKEYTPDFLHPYINAYMHDTPWGHWYNGAQRIRDDYGLLGDLAAGTNKALISGFVNTPIDIWNAVTDDDAEPVDLGPMFGEADGTTGALIEGIGSFLTWFVPLGGATAKATKGLSGTMRLAQKGPLGLKTATGASVGTGIRNAALMGAGAGSDALAFDPAEGNFSTFLANTGLFEGTQLQKVLEYLDSSQHADNPKERIYGRLKNALEGGAIEGIANVILSGMANAFSAAAKVSGEAATSGVVRNATGKAADVVSDATNPIGYTVNKIRELTWETVTSEAKQELEATVAFVLARMRRAEELYKQLESPNNIPARLEQEGFGLDIYVNEHIVPALSRVVSESFGIDIKSAIETVEGFIANSGDIERVFIGGGEGMARSRRNMVEVLAAGNEATQPNTIELFSRDKTGKPRGKAEVDQDSGVAFIRGLQADQKEVAVHEFGHALHAQLLSDTGDPALRKALNDAYDVGDEGWTPDKWEAFAKDYENMILNPDKVPPNKKGSLGQLAAQMRDLRRDTAGTRVRTNKKLQKFWNNLEKRTDLPIRIGPGKYMPPIDWSDTVEQIKQWNEEGVDWRDMIEPADYLAVARIGLEGQRQGRGNIRPSLDPKAGSDFGKMARGTDEDDHLIIAAAYTDLSKRLQREGLDFSPKSVEEIQREADRMFNDLTAASLKDAEKKYEQFFWTDMRDGVGRAAKTVAVNMSLLHQLTKVKRLALKADRTKSEIDYALVQRAYIMFQWLQTQAAQMRTGAGLELYSWRLPAELPTEAKLRELGESGKFLDEVAAGMPSAQRLVEMLKKAPEGQAGVRLIAEMATEMRNPWKVSAEWVGDLFKGLYSEFLLSGPRTMFGLSLVSPMVVRFMDGASGLIGSAVTLQGRQAKQGLVRSARQFYHMMAAGRYALKALVEEQGVLMRDASILEPTMQNKPISPGRLGLGPEGWQPKHPGTMAIKWALKAGVYSVGRLSRLPSSVIQTFDEFYRQVEARTMYETKAYNDAMDQLIASEKTRRYGIGEAEGPRVGGVINDESTKAEIDAFRKANHAKAKKLAEEKFKEVIKDGRIRNEHVIRDEILMMPEVQAIADPVLRAQKIKEVMKTAWTPQHVENVQFAEDYATRSVFQGQLGDSAKYWQRGLDQHTLGIGRIIVPFYRTPMMIIGRFLDYAPTATVVAGVERATRFGSDDGITPSIMAVHKKHVEDIKSGDPQRKADAIGKQIVGTTILMETALLIESGAITGGYPDDPRAREAWRVAGIQPYSIRLNMLPGIGGLFPEGMSVGLGRLDPFFMHTAIVADTIQLIQQGELDDEEQADLFTALLYSTMSMMEQKSYIQGLSDAFRAMEDPQEYGPRWVENFLTSATPMSSLFRNWLDTQDPLIRDYVDMLDHFKGKTVFGAMDEGPQGIAPRFTPLGEPMYKRPDLAGDPDGVNFTSHWNLWSPLTIMWESTDLVDRKLVDMERHLGMPRSKFRGLDLREYTKEDYKWSAYQFWQESTGDLEIRQYMGKDRDDEHVTLRQYLTEYFTEGTELNSLYKEDLAVGRLANGELAVDERVHDIVNEYRQEALQYTVSQFPELKGDAVTAHREFAERLRPIKVQAVENGKSGQGEVDRLDDLIKNLRSQEMELKSNVEP